MRMQLSRARLGRAGLSAALAVVVLACSPGGEADRGMAMGRMMGSDMPMMR